MQKSETKNKNQKTKTQKNKKKISVMELLTWLDGYCSAHDENWAPSLEQWLMIKEKIFSLEMNSQSEKHNDNNYDNRIQNTQNDRNVNNDNAPILSGVENSLTVLASNINQRQQTQQPRQPLIVKYTDDGKSVVKAPEQLNDNFISPFI